MNRETPHGGKNRYDKSKKQKRSKSASHPLGVSNLAALARAARVQDNPKVKNLIRAANYSRNPMVGNVAREYLQRMATEYAIAPDPFAPPVKPEEAQGELGIGIIENAGSTFSLNLAELNQHTLILGRSGAGKTTLILKLLEQLLARS